MHSSTELTRPTESLGAYATPDEINKRIARQLEANVFYYARHPEQVKERLEQLDREWDVERVLETNAGVAALIGATMGFVFKRWRLLPVLVAGFLIQHAVRGYCPPVSLCRRLGVRTAHEINQERYALKALRGDFHAADPQCEPDLDARVARALEAIDLGHADGRHVTV